VNVTTALLCDFAQVREGLLFVSSGGITAAWRRSFPAPLGVFVALVVELDGIESQRPHELGVFVLNQDGDAVAELKGGFQIGPEAPMTGGVVHVPFTFDLRMVGVASPGPHDLRVYVDGNHQRTLTMQVIEGRPPGSDPEP